jgi:hypothetical protein
MWREEEEQVVELRRFLLSRTPSSAQLASAGSESVHSGSSVGEWEIHEELEGVSKAELQERLQGLGLLTTGSKDALLQRLLDALENDNHEGDEEQELEEPSQLVLKTIKPDTSRNSSLTNVQMPSPEISSFFSFLMPTNKEAAAPPPVPAPAILYNQGFHPSIICDRSGMHPIVGMRYHLRGKNYDLCQAEFDELDADEQEEYEAIQPPVDGNKVPLPDDASDSAQNAMTTARAENLALEDAEMRQAAEAAARAEKLARAAEKSVRTAEKSSFPWSRSVTPPPVEKQHGASHAQAAAAAKQAAKADEARAKAEAEALKAEERFEAQRAEEAQPQHPKSRSLDKLTRKQEAEARRASVAVEHTRARAEAERLEAQAAATEEAEAKEAARKAAEARRDNAAFFAAAARAATEKAAAKKAAAERAAAERAAAERAAAERAAEEEAAAEKAAAERAAAERAAAEKAAAEEASHAQAAAAKQAAKADGARAEAEAEALKAEKRFEAQRAKEAQQQHPKSRSLDKLTQKQEAEERQEETQGLTEELTKQADSEAKKKAGKEAAEEAKRAGKEVDEAKKKAEKDAREAKTEAEKEAMEAKEKEAMEALKRAEKEAAEACAEAEERVEADRLEAQAAAAKEAEAKEAARKAAEARRDNAAFFAAAARAATEKAAAKKAAVERAAAERAAAERAAAERAAAERAAAERAAEEEAAAERAAAERAAKEEAAAERAAAERAAEEAAAAERAAEEAAAAEKVAVAAASCAQEECEEEERVAEAKILAKLVKEAKLEAERAAAEAAAAEAAAAADAAMAEKHAAERASAEKATQNAKDMQAVTEAADEAQLLELERVLGAGKMRELERLLGFERAHRTAPTSDDYEDELERASASSSSSRDTTLTAESQKTGPGTAEHVALNLATTLDAAGTATTRPDLQPRPEAKRSLSENLSKASREAGIKAGAPKAVHSRPDAPSARRALTASDAKPTQEEAAADGMPAPPLPSAAEAEAERRAAAVDREPEAKGRQRVLREEEIAVSEEIAISRLRELEAELREEEMIELETALGVKRAPSASAFLAALQASNGDKEGFEIEIELGWSSAASGEAREDDGSEAMDEASDPLSGNEEELLEGGSLVGSNVVVSSFSPSERWRRALVLVRLANLTGRFDAHAKGDPTAGMDNKPAINGVSAIIDARAGPLNDEGAPVALGNDELAGTRHDGRRTVYCGRRLGGDAIPGSDGVCGPTSGPACPSCDRFLASLVNDDGDAVSWGSNAAFSEILYCGRYKGASAIPGSDGDCGPDDGPPCHACRRLLDALTPPSWYHASHLYHAAAAMAASSDGAHSSVAHRMVQLPARLVSRARSSANELNLFPLPDDLPNGFTLTCVGRECAS